MKEIILAGWRGSKLLDGSVSCPKQMKHCKLATMLAIQPSGRFSALEIEGTQINAFLEKPQSDRDWIYWDLFVLSSKILNLFNRTQIFYKKQSLEGLAKQSQFQSYFHSGYCHSMNTLRKKNHLEHLCVFGYVPRKSCK